MINDSEAKWLDKTLQPIYGIINEAILEGFRHRQVRYSEELVNHTSRTRASLTNDLIVVKFLKSELQKHRIRVMKVQNRILFDYDGKVILHFKKLDKFLLSSNLQTEFAYAFTRQQELPGIPTQLPRIIAGYIPTKDWTAIAEMHVTLPKGNKVEWSRSLLEQPATLTDFQELKTHDRAERRDKQKKRVRGKGFKNTPPPSEETGTDPS